jgi:hypothetical protein
MSVYDFSTDRIIGRRLENLDAVSFVSVWHQQHRLATDTSVHLRTFEESSENQLTVWNLLDKDS